jgi:hypothetical protein
VATEAEWASVVAAFDVANRDLLKAVASLDDEQLPERIGDTREPALGSGVSRYVTLHGLVQHHAYHAGQISLLKKSAT